MTNTPDFPGSEFPPPASGQDTVNATAAPTGTLPPPPPSAPAQQPGRRRASGWTIFFGLSAAVMAAMLMAIVGLFALGTAFVAAVASGDIEVETRRVDVSVTPLSIGDLPAAIVEDAADIEVDLTKIDLAELDAATEPVELDIKADFGSITVIVPEDMDVSVDASSDLGDITVFNDSDDGFENTLIREHDSADMVLELDLNVGKIDVVRG